ncbi:nucleoside/nucleotide kinase family protein [Nocardioides cavernae]|uniref:Nucleoside/nucleotide kinase family protein n=1 Tax=Nocardioides cavernae TaxID=1921566 RepID=A0ABR8N517_9ACTN|nr:nucleoside/nucleotide kinase family protein [Nocardioides cavernae]MBD3923248.1 nucleoside/nucleotide kinase family protein [Nocardioides cavernae]MBM7511831.1 pantothenate kinase [Nocardioides cavernae]
MTLSLAALVDRATSLLDRPGRVLLGVTGAPGAGKSTLTETLMSHLRAEMGPDAVGHLPMDGFHLADVQLDRLGRRSRKGAPDTFDVDGYVAALRRLHDEPDRTLFAPGFERDLEQPIAAAMAIPPSARLVVTEGNYLLLPDRGWERVRPLLTEVWHVEVHDDVRRERLVRRHEQYGKSPEAARAWVDQVDQPNARLISATRDAADLIVAVDVP